MNKYKEHIKIYNESFLFKNLSFDKQYNGAQNVTNAIQNSDKTRKKSVY